MMPCVCPSLPCLSRAHWRLPLLCAVLALASLTARAADVAQALQGFDAEVEATLRALNVPGAAVGLVQDGRVVLAKGYGVREAGKPAPVDADTIFAVGSISKSFTTAVMATQVDEGKLDWDRPVREYLPDFRMYDPVATELITPRDMVVHRSGLPRHDFIRMSTYLDRAELVRRIRYMPPSKTFREAYQYNNLLYVAAGHLSGVLAGSTWEDLVHQRLFVPLGMDRSNTSVRDTRRMDNHALPHELRQGRPVPVDFYDYQVFGIGPNGAVNSTVNDMLKYLRMHLEAGRAEDGRQVISSEQVRELLKPVVVSGPDSAYALAWQKEVRHGDPAWSHGGAITGFTAHMILLPERKAGIVVLNNLGSALPARVALRLADRLLGAAGDTGQYLATLAKQPAAPSQSSAEARAAAPGKTAPPSLPLQGYAGTWFHPAYGDIRVEAAGQGLRVVFDALQFDLKHDNHDTFRLNYRDFDPLPVQFLLDTAGRAAQMRLPLEPAVPPFVFERK